MSENWKCYRCGWTPHPQDSQLWAFVSGGKTVDQQLVLCDSCAKEIFIQLLRYMSSGDRVGYRHEDGSVVPRK